MEGASASARSRSPAIAIAIAAAMVLVALALRVAVELPENPPLPDRLMAVLFAAAALCSAGLTIRRLPSAAWLAATAAAGIATVEIVAVARTSQRFAGADLQPWLVALSGAALVSGVGMAAAYAARRRGPAGSVVGPTVTVLGIAAVAASAVASAWALASRAVEPAAIDPALTPMRLAARLSLGLIALGVVVGVGRDLSGPLRRAVDRRRAPLAAAGGARPSFLGALADELLPARSSERRRATETERARLAADLHAFVLPELRQAAAAADSTGVPAEVAARVRRSLDGIEQLMHERQSIVLEEFGLVAALEWLAERTEERSSVRVELELDGDRVEDRSAVPGDVARVAFRVALLALDNVVRHAGASAARVRLSVGSGAVRLSVTDDGRGREAVPTERSGRGLSDMRTEAAATGAELSVAILDAGTRIEIVWPAPRAAGNHAAPATDLAARSDALAP